MTHIRPLWDKVVIKREEEQKMSSSGLLHIPENAQQKSFRGTVLACGPGRILDNGTLVPMSVKVDDLVMLPAHSYNEVKIDGETYLIMHEDDILAVVER